MIIELYASGTEHPALYDAYIDKGGNLYGMSPPARHEFDDLLQVVYEDDGDRINTDQRGAIRFLAVFNQATGVFLFDGKGNPMSLRGFPLTDNA